MSDAFDLFIQRVETLPREQLLAELQVFTDPQTTADLVNENQGLRSELRLAEQQRKVLREQVHRLEMQKQKTAAQVHNLTVRNEQQRQQVAALKQEIKTIELGFRVLSKGNAA